MRIKGVMKRTEKFTPVFYTRGLNAPFTEGHIQITRMIMKSLLLQGIQSVIFNFKYHVSESCARNDLASKFRMEQRIPKVSRNDVLSGRSKSIFAYSLLMETLGTPKFLLFENALKHESCVVNIVNCFRYPRIFVKKMLKAPVVLHFYIPHLRGRYMLRLFGNKADLFIASSQGVAQYLEGHGISKEKVAIVYPPVDTELYKPLSKYPVRSQLDLPKENKIILYIGNLKPTRFPEDKILRVMEELAKEIPETLFLIFAPKNNLNIERANQIRMKAETLGLVDKVKVRVENLSEKEKTSIYAASDVFFFPESGSRAAVEPPLTVLEAMASGRVVLAPKLSASSELITDRRNGFLFEQKDFNNSLARKFADILTNKELRTSVSRCARQTVEQKLSLLTIGSAMVKHFRALTSEHRG